MIQQIDQTPLVIIAFNRPDLLMAQLEIVRAHHKGRVFAIVDGFRTNKKGEAERVDDVVLLFENLRSDFDLSINRSKQNMGCYLRIKSGLDWVFSEVDRAIILEDDCMPSPQFFSFAREMLQKYNEDERIFSISGTNLFPHLSPSDHSYFFSRYPNCWGWATWRRAWEHFIDTKEEWQEINATKSFRGVFKNLRDYLYWRMIFERTYSGKIDSWFYRWILSCWMQNALSIYPPVNMISNLGDDENATHTKNYKLLKKTINNMKYSAKIPRYVCSNSIFDRYLEDQIYSKSLIARILWFYNRGYKTIWR